MPFLDPERLRAYRDETRAKINARERGYYKKRAQDPNYLAKERKRNLDRWNALAPETRMFRRAKNSAKVRGLHFTICLADIPPIPNRCPVFGTKLMFGGKRSDTPSLDRIDNRKGYVPGNLVVVSHRANRLKDDMTIEDMERLVAFYRSLL